MKNIKLIVLYTNGMVGVFDNDGNQIPELQGPQIHAKEKIMEKAKDQIIMNNILYMIEKFRVKGSGIKIEKNEFWCESWNNKQKYPGMTIKELEEKECRI